MTTSALFETMAAQHCLEAARTRQESDPGRSLADHLGDVLEAVTEAAQARAATDDPTPTRPRRLPPTPSPLIA